MEHWRTAQDVLTAVHFEKSFSALHTTGGGAIDPKSIEFVKELGAPPLFNFRRTLYLI